MNNYNRYYDHQNPQNYRQYDLWQNSTFTNGFNLQNEFCSASISRATNGWDPGARESEKTPEETDGKIRRLITRESLFDDPDAFYGHGNPEQEFHEDQLIQAPQLNHHPEGYDWTQQNWRKAGEGSSAQPVQGPSRPALRKGSKLQKKITKALAQPVNMTKAESMMQKMGWQGGALGKTGDGIVEPIAPNAVYATKTVGFGQSATQPKKIKPQTSSDYNREHFNTNVLLNILEFVKNDREHELMFDARLYKDERKSIHTLVNDVINSEDLTVNLDTVAQMDIVQEIQRCNHYTLGTQSDGIKPDRQLCLYKEPPEHVYLVTPDDLKDDNPEDITEDTEDKVPVEIEKEIDKEEVIKEINKMEVDEEETNPFLRSITRNLKNKEGIDENLKDKEDSEESMKNKEVSEENISTEFKSCTINGERKEPNLVQKIIEFFLEFSEQDSYREFRFLGPFVDDEIDAIKSFLNNMTACVNRLECSVEDYAVVLKMLSQKDLGFEIKEESNGSAVIYKLKRDVEKKS